MTRPGTKHAASNETGRRRPKPPSRKKSLAKRMRHEIVPLFDELGFADGRRPPRKGDGPHSALIWPFYRRREGYWDLVSIDWAYGSEPTFQIGFMTEQSERMDPVPGPRSFSGAGYVLADPNSWYQRLRKISPGGSGEVSSTRRPARMRLSRTRAPRSCYWITI